MKKIVHLISFIILVIILNACGPLRIYYKTIYNGVDADSIKTEDYSIIIRAVQHHYFKFNYLLVNFKLTNNSNTILKDINISKLSLHSKKFAYKNLRSDSTYSFSNFDTGNYIINPSDSAYTLLRYKNLSHIKDFEKFKQVILEDEISISGEIKHNDSTIFNLQNLKLIPLKKAPAYETLEP